MADIRCYNCGSQKVGWSNYCLQCGTRLTENPWDNHAIAPDPEEGRRSLVPPAPGFGAVPPPMPAPPQPGMSSDLQTEGAPPRRLSRVVVALAAVLVLVAGAFVLVSTRGNERAYAYQFRAGQSYRYHMTMGMDLRLTSGELGIDQPVKGTIETTMSLQVLSIDNDGIATLRMTSRGGTVSANGKKEPAPEIDSTIRVAPDGRIVSGGGLSPAVGSAGGFGAPGLDQFAPLLPDRVVSPGDSWSKDFRVPFPFGEGSLEYSTENELLRYEVVSGVRAAVIISHVSTPLDVTMDVRALAEAAGAPTSDIPAGTDPRIHLGGSTTIAQTSWVNMEAGRFLKTVSTAYFSMRMRFEDFGPETPTGEVAVTGSMTLEMENLA